MKMANRSPFKITPTFSGELSISCLNMRTTSLMKTVDLEGHRHAGCIWTGPLFNTPVALNAVPTDRHFRAIHSTNTSNRRITTYIYLAKLSRIPTDNHRTSHHLYFWESGIRIEINADKATDKKIHRALSETPAHTHTHTHICMHA